MATAQHSNRYYDLDQTPAPCPDPVIEIGDIVYGNFGAARVTGFKVVNGMTGYKLTQLYRMSSKSNYALITPPNASRWFVWADDIMAVVS